MYYTKNYACLERMINTVLFNSHPPAWSSETSNNLVPRALPLKKMGGTWGPFLEAPGNYRAR